jgi:Tfp pilus assembly protein FimT
MILVMTLISIIAAISFPSVAAGLETLRLNSATNSIVSFLNGGLNRAERRQQPMEVTISRADNSLSLRGLDASFNKHLELPDGIKIERILPENPSTTDEKARSYILNPGGTVPRFGLEIANRRGVRRIVSVDPITGVPLIEKL